MKLSPIILLAVLPAVAYANPYFHSKTGENLVRDFLGPRGHQGELKGQDYLEHEVVRGYIDGIKDATQGTEWCYAGRIKPHELNFELVETIQRLPASARQRNAAPLLVDALRAKFPCPARGGKP